MANAQWGPEPNDPPMEECLECHLLKGQSECEQHREGCVSTIELVWEGEDPDRAQAQFNKCGPRFAEASKNIVEVTYTGSKGFLKRRIETGKCIRFLVTKYTSVWGGRP